MRVHDKIFIGGTWVEPAGTETFEVRNASTEEVIGRVPAGTEEDVDRAVAAAREAFAGPWASSTPDERGDVIAALSAGITARLQEFAELIAQETGCPIENSIGVQVFSSTMVLDYYAKLVREYPFEEERQGAIFRTLVRREPVGVVAGIVPWNVPLFVAVLKLAPALAAGCTIVLKPSPETALDAYLLAEVAIEAGVPDGVINIVAADREVSEKLVVHPGIDKVSFTGSTAAGRRIGSLCGERLRPVTLELGGKSACILLEDADLDTAVPGLLPGSFNNNGQACVAQTRILAPRSRYEEVVAKIAEHVGAMTVGDALEKGNAIGPLASERQRDRVLGYIEKGKAEGARVVVGGGRPEGLDKGWFVEPTVFADVTNDMTIAREEIFGPVLAIIAYDDVDDAVAIANDSPYGLSGGVWSADVEAATEVSRRIATGTVSVNSWVAMDFAAPFGGYKQSGLGRELGPEGLDQLVELKTVVLP
ncbi:aldehyde dehydrogenase [Yinghuangia sp. ASG 101]|uniref:aldehyde dehydrogenase n=1 Tax=Yinghuangia sp. ASG 101 TaxID=2896848 RepID=UPI001E4B47B5|nr:aldehyde dehydrogenase [Yinghuangia sp. ASG 101]UGQ10281.1 aldehyde dehydrogenase [Yinghuangia sp. ASG 101]